MRNVIFVAPFFAETTLRFLDAVTQLPGVRTGLVSQDGADRLPDDLRGRLDAHYRVQDGLAASSIAEGVEAIRTHWGGLDRLVGALEELQVPLGEIRDHLDLPGMRAETARNFRDKARMKEVLRAAGLPCARHGLAHTQEQAVEAARRIGFPLIVKPPAGSGARSTFRIDTPEDLGACLRALPPSSERPTLLEEFVVGEEHSFDSVMVDGHLAWHSINHYLPSPLEVLREPWIQWAVLLPREVDDPRYDGIRQVAGSALGALGMENGMSHMEWFRRPDGSVAISEVGARPPGARFVNLISHAHDFDLFAAWARLVVFGQFQPPARRFAAGVAYLRAQGSGARIAAVHGLRDLQQKLGGIVAEARLPEPGQRPSGTYEGEGYILVKHPDTAVVRDALAAIVQTVRVVVEPA
ncbi:MAG: ATP-grasp domain-containing protein [Gemmatimonadota bacterium]|nr:ATP-grasp domain-containing protein [Gemmatimonadota bacterium]